ncbi:hypothetical protein [Croceitalea rosinachiae]|uniref:Peptidoglycan-binding protein LysM n=1 Tax=Croceitalea rosinachiae TaxID=3075596 RepID=A0ABU3ABQ2_9FLAO|nr:hypothetical protein [Croceitalea sp. F388]MDT0607250.1 hypothetical protein [Croceitalea sp. F388]
MKRWIGFLGHLAIIIIFTSFGTYSFKTDMDVKVPNELKVLSTYSATVPVFNDIEIGVSNGSPVMLGNSYIGFKEALAFKESQGNYNTINTLGYLGKYQFGSGTLRLMGVSDTSFFLSDANLQEKVFELNVARNKWILRRDIKRFIGKKINGIVISESGIIAAAHLAGAGNVKKYLRSYGQTDFSDAYGSSIAYYMKKFRDYNISIVKAKHNPKV